MIYLAANILRLIMEERKNGVKFLIFLFLIILSYSIGGRIPHSLFHPSIFLDRIVFYTFFFCLGIYVKNFPLSVKFSLFAILLNTIIFILIFGLNLNPQKHKFPPDIYYLIYSLFSIFVAQIAINYEQFFQNISKKRIIKIVLYAGKHSFALYLAQGIATSLPYFWGHLLLELEIHIIFKFLFNVLFVFSITFFIAYIHINISVFFQKLLSRRVTVK